jgi:hypothetical protein
MLYPVMGKAPLEAVIAMLRTASSRKSECLMRQLPTFGKDAVAPLTALLHDGSEQGRQNAASGLVTLGEYALVALPDLESALNDPSDRVRVMVLDTLASLQPRSPVLTLDLLQRLQRATPGTQECEALIQTIERMGSLPVEALPVLTHVLGHLPAYDERAAETAIDAIGHVSAPQRLVLLARLVGDPNPRLAWRATLTIGRSGHLGLAGDHIAFAGGVLPGRHRYADPAAPCASVIRQSAGVATAPEPGASVCAGDTGALARR